MAADKKKAAKAAPKKAAAKAAPKAAAKPTPVKESWSKTQILNEISERTQLARKQVTAVMAELEGIMARHIGKSGPGDFVLPGLLKITTVKKPAQKARKGIDPFTKQERMFAAKPASVKVKIRPLKKLKDMAG